MRIVVWICPECGDRYSATGVGDLATEMVRRTAMRNSALEDPSEWGKIIGTRADCPVCKEQGKQVQREPRVFYDQQAIEEAIASALQKAHQQAAKQPTAYRGPVASIVQPIGE